MQASRQAGRQALGRHSVGAIPWRGLLNLLLEEKEDCGFFDNVIPVVPQTWYHICVGINTLSGLLRIVDNGVLIVNEEKEYFRNTASSIKPQNIAGNLLGMQ